MCFFQLTETLKHLPFQFGITESKHFKNYEQRNRENIFEKLSKREQSKIYANTKFDV